ncbi:MAG TPA: RhuM family protein [Bacteroidales bacterium]|nr:RhuM family protein [Bacteroidales bacterium]
MEKAEIIIYQAFDNQINLEVRYEDETIWLTQAQIVDLFSSSKANVSEHIKHIFKSGELDPEATVRKIRTVQIEGGRKVFRYLDHYNLDVIISIGYRVNSIRGTQFRIWASQVLKDYLLKGYAVNQRIDRIETKLLEQDQKFDLLIKANLPPHEGIFYEGQIFDAHHFVSGVIKAAERSIILIDNYIDESVLILLSKRKPGTEAILYTGAISKQMKLDVERFNAQYPKIEIKKFDKAHDRFLIVDYQTVYHIGASLKDLGKKWFAFSKIGLDAREMIEKLEAEEGIYEQGTKKFEC